MIEFDTQNAFDKANTAVILALRRIESASNAIAAAERSLAKARERHRVAHVALNVARADASRIGKELEEQAEGSNVKDEA